MIKFTSLLVLTTALSSASTIHWVTPAGSRTSGTVNTSATVVTEDGRITVTLSNLLANPNDVGQLVSGFSFTLSSTPTTTLGTISTPTGSLITIDRHGERSASSDAILPWNLTNAGATILLERLGADDAPSQLIIGPGPYTNANGSIAHNRPHNPFLDGSAKFTFDVAGVTAATSVRDVTFNFGTTRGVTVPGICSDCDGGGRSGSEVPEPLSAILIGGGLLGVGIFGKLRRA